MAENYAFAQHYIRIKTQAGTCLRRIVTDESFTSQWFTQSRPGWFPERPKHL